MRHTMHAYPNVEQKCTTLFGTVPNVDLDYATHKRGYLLAFTDVTVTNNGPLTRLLRNFRMRCGRSIGGPLASPLRMTHDQILAIFDRALEQDDWPTSGDSPRTFVAPGETMTSSADEAGARSESKRRKKDAVATVTRLHPRKRTRAHR